MSPGTQLSLLSALAVLLVAAALFCLSPLARNTPQKRERKRRLEVNRQGRLGDAFITEVTESTIHYTYELRGVQYETSQDITWLRDYLPPESQKLIGQAHVKYLVNHPANSILVCEEWSGLKIPSKPVVSEPARTSALRRA